MILMMVLMIMNLLLEVIKRLIRLVWWSLVKLIIVFLNILFISKNWLGVVD